MIASHFTCAKFNSGVECVRRHGGEPLRVVNKSRGIWCRMTVPELKGLSPVFSYVKNYMKAIEVPAMQI